MDRQEHWNLPMPTRRLVRGQARQVPRTKPRYSYTVGTKYSTLPMAGQVGECGVTGLGRSSGQAASQPALTDQLRRSLGLANCNNSSAGIALHPLVLPPPVLSGGTPKAASQASSTPQTAPKQPRQPPLPSGNHTRSPGARHGHHQTGQSQWPRRVQQQYQPIRARSTRAQSDPKVPWSRNVG